MTEKINYRNLTSTQKYLPKEKPGIATEEEEIHGFSHVSESPIKSKLSVIILLNSSNLVE